MTYRSDRLVRIADIAVSRVARSLERIDDMYAAPGRALDEQITREEFLREIEETGHMPPGEGCTRPVCEKARRMIMRAYAQIGAV